MRLSAAPVVVLLFIFAVCTAAASTQVATGRVRGVVADGSGGVLPGVTVVAASEDGQLLTTTVTDAVGGFELGSLPVGRVRLTFQLEGFASAVVDVAVAPDREAVVRPRLLLAPRAETVLVVAKAPVDAPPPPRRAPPPPPPPPPAVIPVAEHDRDSICGPAKADAAAESLGTIRSRRHEAPNGLFAKDDEVVIDGGTQSGLAVGQNVVVRRTYRVSGDPHGAVGEHTAGLLQIVGAGERASIGVVVYACDELMRGDRLAPFNPEPIQTPEPARAPVFDSAARILFADAGQLVGAPRRLMVIDRGRDGGIRAGQRMTLFRRAHFGSGSPVIVGDAVVVAVRADSATIRVERATDAIASGDWAATQK
jgi:hypothetical protein